MPNIAGKAFNAAGDLFRELQKNVINVIGVNAEEGPEGWNIVVVVDKNIPQSDDIPQEMRGIPVLIDNNIV